MRSAGSWASSRPSTCAAAPWTTSSSPARRRAGPTGFAEVSLTFDAQTLAPDVAPGGVPWGAAGPRRSWSRAVSIATGESEYLLNGVPSRLRDVVEFFLGTGVGSKAYAIIEQGRIGFIVVVAARRSARPLRRGGRHHQVQGQEEGRRAAHGFDAPAPAARVRHHRRDRDPPALAAPAGAEGRALQALQGASCATSSCGRRRSATSASSPRRSRWPREHGELRERHATSSAAGGRGGVGRGRAAGGRRGGERAGDGQGRICSRCPTRRSSACSGPAPRGRGDGADRAGRGGAPGGRGAAVAGTAQAATIEEIDGQAVADIDAAAERREPSTKSRRGCRTSGARRWRQARARAGRGLAESRGQRAASRATRPSAAAALRGATIWRRGSRRRDRGRRGGRAHRGAASTTKLRCRRRRGAGARRSKRRGARTEEEARLAAVRAELGRGELELETLREEAHRRRSRLASLMEIQDRYESFQKGVRAIMQQQRERGAAAPGSKAWSPTSCSRRRSWRPRSRRCWASGSATSSSSRTRSASRRSSSSSRTSEGRSSFIPFAAASRGRARADARRAGRWSTTRACTVERRRRIPTSVLTPVVDSDAVADGLAAGRRRARADAGAHRLRPAVRRGRDLPARRRAGGRGSRARAALWRETRTDKTIVTLDGEVIDPHGVVTGGSRESAVAGVLEQKREIRELEEVMERLDADVEAALARQASASSRSADDRARARGAGAALRADEMALLRPEEGSRARRRRAAALEARRRASCAAQSAIWSRRRDDERAAGRGATRRWRPTRARRRASDARAGAARSDAGAGRRRSTALSPS